MLSVNRILIFLFLGIYSSSLYAIDVSNFDIKGIKLGMSKSEVLKKMPCASPTIEMRRLNSGKLSGTYIECSSSYFRVILDHHKIVYHVSKKIDFNIEPNLSRIKNKLIKKYGKLNKTTKKKIIPKSSDNGKIISFCWGNCKVHYTDNGYWKGSEMIYSGSKLLVEYINIYHKNGEHAHYLSLLLDDPKTERKNEKWENTQNKIYEKQQKEKASNIDF